MDSNETLLLKIKHWTAVVSLLHYRLSLICTLLPESRKKKSDNNGGLWELESETVAPLFSSIKDNILQVVAKWIASI